MKNNRENTIDFTVDKKNLPIIIILMQEGRDEQEYSLFEDHVELRLNIIKKRISDYFQELEKAIGEKRQIPLPKDFE